MRELISKSILAGFLISVAGAIFLRCDNKIIGALLFSIGLIGVISFKANLFTGKVGYINSKQTLKEIFIILLFNILAAVLVGFIFHLCCGLSTAMDSRLTKEWYQLLWDGFICGICIYLSVEGYKLTNNIIVIILPVMAFILSGAEHSIADFFYWAASGFPYGGFSKLLIIIVGNSIGSLLTRYLQLNFKLKTE